MVDGSCHKSQKAEVNVNNATCLGPSATCDIADMPNTTTSLRRGQVMIQVMTKPMSYIPGDPLLRILLAALQVKKIRVQCTYPRRSNAVPTLVTEHCTEVLIQFKDASQATHEILSCPRLIQLFSHCPGSRFDDSE
ncbi:hypothetical protein P171DRAFT_277178 [Karstenula rhodostoma CBS 690.94]|uniref:Uncharacterized protein n=1 Tax=Karstenula rhodostoma CBS 690.94 TaxID=1392251 RepID=A0A9P4UDA6_9PLEO|nr:hypothetical protein P171DRAFT_277178 [Karstenula rhodostoma CBS 690.94]